MGQSPKTEWKFAASLLGGFHESCLWVIFPVINGKVDVNPLISLE